LESLATILPRRAEHLLRVVEVADHRIRGEPSRIVAECGHVNPSLCERAYKLDRRQARRDLGWRQLSHKLVGEVTKGA
jgi:hypothetical protein